MENKVLTQEEIQSLKAIQTNQSNLVQTLGTIEYRIQLLELDKQTLKSQLQKQVEEETKVAKELQEKYLKTLTEKEFKGYEIAKSHLGLSFQLEKSNGYLEWKKKQTL